MKPHPACRDAYWPAALLCIAVVALLLAWASPRLDEESAALPVVFVVAVAAVFLVLLAGLRSATQAAEAAALGNRAGRLSQAPPPPEEPGRVFELASPPADFFTEIGLVHGHASPTAAREPVLATAEDATDWQ